MTQSGHIVYRELRSAIVIVEFWPFFSLLGLHSDEYNTYWNESQVSSLPISQKNHHFFQYTYYFFACQLRTSTNINIYADRFIWNIHNNVLPRALRFIDFNIGHDVRMEFHKQSMLSANNLHHSSVVA